MHKIVKITKNPLTWIAFIGLCIIAAIVWAFKKDK